MSDLLIRRMMLADVDQVAAIERATFSAPWSKASFAREMTTNKVARYLVAEEQGRVIGFAGVHIILEEGHVTNIALTPEHRGKGLGKRLTLALMQYAANLGVDYLTLEVRCSNEKAIALYRALGFHKVSVRKRYYEDNGEDAWLMACDQMPAADPDFEEPETVRE